MLFWIRELAGWGLIAVSLVLVRMGLNLAMNTETPQIVEASVVMFGAIGVMRSGVLLIRMSTAARLCRNEKASDS
jgi:hypothetical protein